MNAAGLIVAILVAGLLGPKIAERGAKRQRQENVLSMLITSYTNFRDPAWQTAINLIPIEFQNKKSVIELHSDYIRASNVDVRNKNKSEFDAANFVLRDSQFNLIVGVAHSLSIKGITKISLNNLAYTSSGFADRDSLSIQAMEALVRIANAIERQEYRNLPPPEAEAAADAAGPQERA